MGIVARALGRECVDFTDAAGVQHKLPPLDAGDWADLDSIMEGGIPSWRTWATSMRWALVVVWLSARKEGMSRLEVNAAVLDRTKWRVTAQDVRGWFANFVDLFEARDAVLSASGYLKPDTAEQVFARRVREIVAEERDLSTAKARIDEAWAQLASDVAAREASDPLAPKTAPSPTSEPSSGSSSPDASPAGSPPTT